MIIAPYYMNGGHVAAFNTFEKAQAVELHKTGSMTISDRVHPNQAGHEYIARHLAGDLRKVASKAEAALNN